MSYHNKCNFREHNKLFHANKTTFRLGENSHADMTAKEFAEKLNGYHKKTGSHGPWNPTQAREIKFNIFFFLLLHSLLVR